MMYIWRSTELEKLVLQHHCQHKLGIKCVLWVAEKHAPVKNRGTTSEGILTGKWAHNSAGAKQDQIVIGKAYTTQLKCMLDFQCRPVWSPLILSFVTSSTIICLIRFSLQEFIMNEKISNFEGKASYLEPFLYNIKWVTCSFWECSSCKSTKK
jgi:hypothetical protein